MPGESPFSDPVGLFGPVFRAVGGVPRRRPTDLYGQIRGAVGGMPAGGYGNLLAGLGAVPGAQTMPWPGGTEHPSYEMALSGAFGAPTALWARNQGLTY
jgi:hypothetical protein